ncbi:hypothetical protein E8E13_006588 [Curvularia kusanoi]|uniref:Bacteriophage T5 Orf172 DNA-binding domain-containing protein n=1 Tax=Curvularia kusanoi TaxID=90978 RepID=A0A9P4W6H3_CURKU|nr:hypothetical protein E8E13_006588 [Curvularia kusanoi]
MSSKKPSTSLSGSVGSTPAKGTAPVQNFYTLSLGESASDSKITGRKPKRGSLEAPESPTGRFHKKAKSISDLTAGLAGPANVSAATASRSKDPNRCTKKGKIFVKEGHRANHARGCPDPRCEHQFPLAREAPLNDGGPFVRGQSLDDPYMISDDDERQSAQDEDAPSSEERPTSDNAGSGEDSTPINPNSSSPPEVSQMHRILRKKLKKGLTENDEKGWIYVIYDTQRPHLCKIGKSVDSDKRASQIQRACKTSPEVFNSINVNYYTRAEGLVHAYFSDKRKRIECTKCAKGHCEWFDISPEAAMAGVRKWATFMNQQNPYHIKSRELKSFWSLWLNSPHILNAQDIDADGFRARWDKILEPSSVDYYRVWFNRGRELVLHSFWPVFATLAWTLVFVIVQHPAAFLLMATSVVGACFSMSNDKHYLGFATAKLK